MPHAVFSHGETTATTEAIARPLIPGVEPGGSRVGQATKPALLIRDCWVEPIDVNVTGGVGGNFMSYYLKLSQESDMTPGLLLPIAVFGAEVDSEVAATGIKEVVKDLFRAQGTVWAPRFVGVRVVEVGAAIVNADVHLDYERVDVPWMDWFIMWDFLDGIADNEKEY